MKKKVACFLVPVLTAVVLLYQVLASLQIAVTHNATLLIIGVTMAIAAAAGLVAAIGPPVIRVGVLAACALLFLDVTFRLSNVFEHLRPEGRIREKRIADIRAIKSALDEYVARVGPLPSATEYGEGAGPDVFFEDWWDLSSHDGNGDGRPFLEFLVDGGILPAVPVDPVNQSTDEDPRVGKQYVYFLVPPSYGGVGGSCVSGKKQWVYMLGITDLEDETSRPPTKVAGSGCACLWRDDPNYFDKLFDYVVCGTFDVTPASLARAAAVKAAQLSRKQAEAERTYGAQDRRRVSDLLQIKQGLQKYLANVGPLPAPIDYGEAERSRTPVFWKSFWDVSTEDGDGDGDGRMFLDFLVESGIMPSVPIDPDNEAAPDGDPRGGRQYVYFVVDPGYGGVGGSCVSGKKQWVYMLGITDLRSELTRPPTRIVGSGCECLWRDQPDYFQQHFDYVTCGTFSR